jgi:hypothetical protein
MGEAVQEIAFRLRASGAPRAEMDAAMEEGAGSAGGPGHRGMTIRSRLLLLAAAMLVPYALLAAFGTFREWNEATERALAAQAAEAERVAAQFESHVTRIRELLAAIESTVSDDLEDEARNDEQLSRLWDHVSATVATLSVVAPDGRMIASANAARAKRRPEPPQNRCTEVGKKNPTTQNATPTTPSAAAIHTSAEMAVMIEAEASTIAISADAEASSK